MTQIDPRLRKLLMTMRAALIMGAKAIEEYCRDDARVETVSTIGDNINLTTENTET